MGRHRKSDQPSRGKMLDAVHYFVVDEGANLAAAALSILWCGASLHLLLFAENDAKLT
jgi:hypothetical protein